MPYWHALGEAGWHQHWLQHAIVLVLFVRNLRRGPVQEPVAPVASGSTLRRGEERGSRKDERRAYQVLQRSHYESCKVIGPDGNFMFSCNRKRVNWYLSRGLAELVTVQPAPTIRLLFQPKGPGNLGNKYYETEHQNLCVVCGEMVGDGEVAGGDFVYAFCFCCSWRLFLLGMGVRARRSSCYHPPPAGGGPCEVVHCASCLQAVVPFGD